MKRTLSTGRARPLKSIGRAGLVLLAILTPIVVQAGIRVKVIQGPSDLPEPFCELAQKGDFLIMDGSYEYLVGGTSRRLNRRLNILNLDENAMGCILCAVATGKHLKDGVVFGTPIINLGSKSKILTYASVEQRKGLSANGGAILESTASLEEPGQERLRVRTSYEFLPGQGKIQIRSIVTNTGKMDLKELSFALSFDPNVRYYFTPYHKKYNRFSRSYEQYHPNLNFQVYQKERHALGILDPNPIQADQEHPWPGALGPGQSYQIQYMIWADGDSSAVLKKIYSQIRQRALPVDLRFEGFPGQTMEVVVREESSSSVFFRAFLEHPEDISFPLPVGEYTVTANFFPAVASSPLSVKEGTRNSCLIRCPPLGRIRISVQDRRGLFVPGKVTFFGLASTKNPYFEPDNPVRSGRDWEFFKNSRYAREQGIEVSLAAGTYLVFASRGPEYTIDQKVIEVLKNRPLELKFVLDRVLPPLGWVSVDSHLHTQESDGAVGVPERLRSIVAEDLDVAVATDHNFITDYLPELKRSGLDRYLTVLAGSEVTPFSGFIHFCVFPQEIKREEMNHGAVPPRSESSGELFRENREANPGALLQLNHPRGSKLGYFNNLHLDDKTAASADKGLDLSFDLFEAMNGSIFGGPNAQAVEDWLHLLCRGYFFPAVGGSDAHLADGTEPGYSRTYVFLGRSKNKGVEPRTLVAALKRGRSFVSNGPLVDFRVNKKYLPGDFLTARKGKVSVSLRVLSAPWVSVSEARIIINGVRKEVFQASGKESDPVKLDRMFNLVLDTDAFIAVEVVGDRSLFPVVQMSSLVDSAALPYALTNPVFVDVDGNGRFDPPWPEKVKEGEK